jgi:hypothetical protein
VRVARLEPAEPHAVEQRHGPVPVAIGREIAHLDLEQHVVEGPPPREEDGFWKTMPRLVCGRSTAVPAIVTVPDVGDSSPAMIMASVDLPQPEGPTMETNSPLPTVNDTPSSADTTPSRAWKRRTTSRTSTVEATRAYLQSKNSFV